MQPTSLPLINVVFDIDGVLACQKASSKKQAAFFFKKGAIISANNTHYIFPGVIEFIQKLFLHTPNVRVSFYSAQKEKRNIPFVANLLIRSLGNEKYQQIKENVAVFSRNHLAKLSIDQVVKQKTSHGISGEYKKDISIALREGESLEHSVLIEDDESFIFPGQERCAIVSPKTHEKSFHELLLKSDEVYDKQGYCEISCYFPNPEKRETHKQILSKCHERQILAGERITLEKRNFQYFIGFANQQTYSVEELTLTQEKHATLIKSLDVFHETQELYWISNGPLINEIHRIVAERNGKTKRFCAVANRIYYIAGMLFKAIETAQERDVAVTDVLFERQFRHETDGTYHPLFYASACIDDIYHYGLRKLREINPNLEFTTPTSYKQALEQPISESERIEISQMIQEEAECVVM